MESPWGRVQFALIYDTLRTPDPAAQRGGARARGSARNPGRFTHDRGFTGTGFHTLLLYALNGGAETFRGGFDEAATARGSARCGSGWRRTGAPSGAGAEVYPAEVADLHRLFANGEVDFSMSYNENEVVTKVRQGVLPASGARAPAARRDARQRALPRDPLQRPEPRGSHGGRRLPPLPEAQLEKLRPEVWADGTVLAVERLPEAWRRRFEALQADPRSLPADSLRRYAVPEVAPEYAARLAEDWRARVRGGELMRARTPRGAARGARGLRARAGGAGVRVLGGARAGRGGGGGGASLGAVARVLGDGAVWEGVGWSLWVAAAATVARHGGGLAAGCRLPLVPAASTGRRARWPCSRSPSRTWSRR